MDELIVTELCFRPVPPLYRGMMSNFDNAKRQTLCGWVIYQVASAVYDGERIQQARRIPISGSEEFAPWTN